MRAIYLAAPYTSKEELRVYAAALREAGFEVTSRWLDEPHSTSIPFRERDADEMRAYSQRDVDDVERADVFVFFSVDPEQPMKRGGRHVEFGLAVAMKKRIIVVGPRENIFHHLPSVELVAEWRDALELLTERGDDALAV